MTQSNQEIRDAVLDLFRQRDYRPLDKVEIARQLGLKANKRVALRQELRELERAGEIARIRKNRYVIPSEADLITGTISIHQAGFGFLTTEKPGEPDIYIAAENTGIAMHGDRVVARISRDVRGRRRPDRAALAEGRIIRILERAHDTIVGTLQQSRNFYYVVPDDPRFVHDVYVASVAPVPDRRRSQPAATVGDKVVIRLDSWTSRHVNPEGEIIEVLGPASAPGVDMLSIIRKYHLPTEFPRDVLEQVAGVPETVDAQQLV